VNSPKNYLILLLAVTTIGGALLAWRQYTDLTELRAAAMNKDERADLQKRIWDLEKLNRALRDQVASQRGPNAEGDGLATAIDGERPERDGRGRGGRGDPRRDGFGQQFTAIRDLMAKPEVQAMVNLQQQSAIDGRYAALFKNLNLQPDQVDRLKTLLAERSTTNMDVMSAARDQGIDPRQNPEAFRKLLGDAQNEINNSIKGVIGEAGFAQLTNYEQTLPQRNVVNQLEQRLSYSSTPLTSSQSEQLVQILANTAPTRSSTNEFDGPMPGGRGPGGFGGGPPPGRGPDLGGMIAGVLGPGAAQMAGMFESGRGGATAPVTTAAITQAQSILAPTQLQALQQIQQQQQSQQQLRQLVTETLSTNQPVPPGAGQTDPARGPGGNMPPPPRKRPGGE
jgi:hypothetical protein